MARNDTLFVAKWIDYYGKQLGTENLFLVLDGHDQTLPHGHESINVIRVPHQQFGRLKGDRNRARLMSHFARALFFRYDIIIAHDIDEFLVLDPNVNESLSEYLQRPVGSASLSGLGLDVGQHLEREPAIDLTRPFLEQRRYAHVSARYTKPVVALAPLTWGSGYHRVKGKNFNIDPNLYVFHFGMVDYNISKEKMGDTTLLNAGWSGHLGRRYQLFHRIAKNDDIDGDAFFKTARRWQRFFRPFFSINKPGMPKGDQIIKIPERFKSLV